eukprot:m.117381 g.117381  ORF g.117381 m.117381 type:complete len:65 (+) comp9516_c0_seq5:1700-1894(+)
MHVSQQNSICILIGPLYSRSGPAALGSNSWQQTGWCGEDDGGSALLATASLSSFKSVPSAKEQL